MQRIPSARDEAIDPRAQELLEAAGKKLGSVPNMLRAMAHPRAALEAYLGLSDVLSNGVLSSKLREQIALAMAGANRCGYCASAHTAVGRMLSIDEAELADNLAGRSRDPRTAAVLSLVREIVETRGGVDDAALDRARAAGLSNGEIVEIVAHVTLNAFTNWFNRLAEPEIDFPVVDVDELRIEPIALAS